MSSPDLSVLFISYNRSDLLLRALTSLSPSLVALDLAFEIIVADDCSQPPHSEAIDAMGGVKVVRAISNSGLGRNTNNGISACNGEFILQVQDDCEYVADSSELKACIAFLIENPEIGIVQLTPVGSDLPAKAAKCCGAKFLVFRNDRLPWSRNCSRRPYSDQPHIKRREFVEDIGPYLEGVSMGVCENNYKRRVANQNRWKVAVLAMDHNPCFVHLGKESSFNKTGRIHPLVGLLRRLPWGEQVLEPPLRRIHARLDNLAARMMSR